MSQKTAKDKAFKYLTIQKQVTVKQAPKIQTLKKNK